MTSFAIGETDFLLDGKPFQILSGAIHYFRVHPEQWADRIEKARLMGLNTIETYVAWNAHEPREGEWNQAGWNDLGRFLDLVADAGMYAIVRPGPYICAEWHNGGLPVWLTSMPGIGLRRNEPKYMEAVTRYLRNIYEIVAPRQIDRGGKVILVQVENEYGAYGNDKEYLRELVQVTRDADITVPLTTVDQPVPYMLEDGSLPGLHMTGSFGSRATERLATLSEYQTSGPLMCSEFWDGWFDWWGGVHHTTSAADSATELEALLAAGASVNFYMAHGGTNFGLTNGGNHKGRYLPLLTSYDYDAPIGEYGNLTDKFHAFREVISRYAPVPEELPDAPAPAPSFDVDLTGDGDWLSSTKTEQHVYETPPTFEQLAYLGPLIRYETEMGPSDRPLRSLNLEKLRDGAWVEVDGVPVGSVSRIRHQTGLAIPAGKNLTVLVEEQGRVNYGPRIGEPKGLVGQVALDGQPLTGWTATPIDVEKIASELLDRETLSGESAGRCAYRGEFDLTEQSDLFLDTSSLGKGYAFLNGFFLGRYWSNGPQETLYVPGPETLVGRNTLVLLELEHAADLTARFVAQPELGPLAE